VANQPLERDHLALLDVGNAAEDLLGDWRRFGPLGFDVVLSAALDGFLAAGYHGCSTRDIAQRAGLSVASLYRYHDNKQSMLVTLLDLTMDDLLRRARLARDEGKTPANVSHS
jgi:Bacterial regulatory proteins, tetR family